MSEDSTYQIGIAYRNITPTKEEFESDKLYLWGFGDENAGRSVPVTQTRSTATGAPEDGLRVTALTISASNGTVVLMALDMGALSEAITAEIRSALQANHGIPPEHICINVSHTHAAPSLVSMPTWQAGVATAYSDYVDRVVEEAIGCVDDALENPRSARLYAGRGTSAIGGARNNEAAGYDNTLDVLVAKDSETEETLATAFSVACHPVVVDENVVSSDFPGVARALVEKDHKGISMFLQGFAGQTDPLNREDPYAVGKSLFKEVDEVLKGSLAQITGPLMGRRAMTYLPLVTLKASWEPVITQDPTTLSTRWMNLMASQMPNKTDQTEGTVATEVQTLRVGDGASQLRVLASSHEPTCDLGLDLRELLPADRVTTLGYCNIQCCYIPSKAVLQRSDVRPGWPDVNTNLNYEGGASFLWYGRRAPFTDAALDQYMDAFRTLVDDPWEKIGHASSVTALAASGDTLYATTTNNFLWSRSATGGDEPWTNLGHAFGIRGLAALGNDLFAATETNRLVKRPMAGVDVAWTEIGQAEQVTAMTAHEGKLYAATQGNTLWKCNPVNNDFAWEGAGSAMSVAGLASAAGQLIAVTTTNILWWRKSATTWSRLGTAPLRVGLTALGNTLFMASSEDALWKRTL